MYVVTFYSFKGGVGRSMALMNTAAALVADGRRVLVVDFDLEAPGLDTFNLPQPKGKTFGIVDFVFEYMTNQVAPAIENYVYKSSFNDASDMLWIMPAGNRDEKYPNRLNSINWKKLYQEGSGFFLLEDMKAQWKDYLDPDYVLIDSRTGHTDVGGICTRQLPDAVVCLFFPNQQNLLGLEPIVNRIKGENTTREDGIALHFVASNVPDLDDEMDILKDNLSRFKRQLGYRELASMINHYSSLALLDQDIFVITRPNSRLSVQYRELVTIIQEANVEDRIGAISFLRKQTQGKYSLRAQRGEVILDEDEREKWIENIVKRHGNDIEVLKEIVLLREQAGQFEEVDALLSSALKLDPTNPYLLTRKAVISDRLEQKEQAVESSLIAVQQQNLGEGALNQVIRILASNKSETLKDIHSWPAITDLRAPRLSSLARSLSFERNLLPEAERLIRFSVKKTDRDTPQYTRVMNELIMNLIGQRKFGEAVKVSKGILEQGPAQFVSFNLAVATWGKTAQVPADIFQSVLEFDPEITNGKSPNYLQCMSLANWAVGKLEIAEKLLARARGSMTSYIGIPFSCWSYLYRRPTTFRLDLDQQEAMFSDQKIYPEVISK